MMNETILMDELGRTRNLCEQVENLFGAAESQGRMMSMDEASLADRLSLALLEQIRRLPRNLRLRECSPAVQVKAGETIDLVRLSLRKLSGESIRGARPRASLRNISAYGM